VTVEAAAGCASTEPHCPQCRCPAGLECPHTEHAARSRRPALPQNFWSAGFSCWQDVQRMVVGDDMVLGYGALRLPVNGV